MNHLYCIFHEKMVAVADQEVCNGHTMEVVVTEDNGVQHIEIDCCEFPLGFAYCPPPESLFKATDGMEYSEWSSWCIENDPENQTELISIEVLEGLYL